jgi:prevent-host-death family protein
MIRLAITGNALAIIPSTVRFTQSSTLPHSAADDLDVRLQTLLQVAYGAYVSYARCMTAALPLPNDDGELGITDARDRLAEIVNEAAYTGSVTYITRRGRRVAAIVPAVDAERLEHAEDAYLARLAGEALAEVEGGAPTVPWDQVKADLEADR